MPNGKFILGASKSCLDADPQKPVDGDQEEQPLADLVERTWDLDGEQKSANEHLPGLPRQCSDRQLFAHFR
jgi:hypothetical protein